MVDDTTQGGYMPDKDAPQADACDANLVALLEDHIAKSRGYATYWTWGPNPKYAEKNAAAVLQKYLVACGEHNLKGHLEIVETDPPDIAIKTPHGPIAVEVTELVDSNAAAEYRKRAKGNTNVFPQWASWDAQKIANKIEERIDKKEKKMQRVSGYVETLLAIVTDEPMIDIDLAAKAVAECSIVSSFIDRAFILLSYKPELNDPRFPDNCPVFPIPLTRP